MITRVRSVIIPPIANSFNCFVYILFTTFVTSKEVNEAFFNAVKSLITFVSFSCNRTGKTVRFMNILVGALTPFHFNVLFKKGLICLASASYRP